jgi:dihydropyrimidinase
MSDAAAFDLVIRKADVAMAADRFTADIGVRDGRIVALGSELPRGASEIDAGGRLVTPDGVHSHCHLE